jgi:subtilisin-like proprotein convertase family protein
LATFWVNLPKSWEDAVSAFCVLLSASRVLPWNGFGTVLCHDGGIPQKNRRNYADDPIHQGVPLMSYRQIVNLLAMVLFLTFMVAVPVSAQEPVADSKSLISPEAERVASTAPKPQGGLVPPNCPNNTVADFIFNQTVIAPNAPNTVSHTFTLPEENYPYTWMVTLKTDIDHTASGDLDMTLRSPEGTVVTITSDNGSALANLFGDTMWDDRANPGGQVPYTVNPRMVTDHPYINNTPVLELVPEESLGAFQGENPAGEWTLTISDDSAGNGGLLKSGWLSVISLPVQPEIAFVGKGNFNNPQPIPTGPSLITSTIEVSGETGVILDLDVLTFISHTYSADLDITVQSPSGTVATLSSDNGGSYDNLFAQTYWDDQANPGGQVPYTTNNGMATDHNYAANGVVSPLTPEEPLSIFRGENPNGVWILTVSDDQADDGGELEAWNLDFELGDCVVPQIELSPDTFDITADPGAQEITRTLTIHNAGNAELDWSIDADNSACDFPPQAPWASLGRLGSGFEFHYNMPAGATDTLELVVDTSALLPGVHIGAICLQTNDPTAPGVSVTVNLTVPTATPTVAIQKTVGTLPNLCGTEETLAVNAGSTVYYCYTVTNTGNTPLLLHSLQDMGGQFIFQNLPYPLEPGDSFDTVSAGIEVSRTVNSEVTDTAIWRSFPNNTYLATTSNQPNGPTYAFTDIRATGEALDLGGESDIIRPLPFTFPFYHHAANSLQIFNNGVLSVGGDWYAGRYNYPLPTHRLRHAIAPLWDDLGSESGNVWYEVQGEVGNRVAIVQWERAGDLQNMETPSTALFQAQLYEGTGEIRFVYADTDFGDTDRDLGASATVGLNLNGVIGHEFSSSDPVLTTPLAIRFAPVGSGQNVQTNDSTTVTIGEFAEISIFPAAVNASHDPGGQVTTATLTIQNDGDADLTWTLTEDGIGLVCDAPSAIGWVSAIPTQGTSAPGGFYNVVVTVDSTGLSDGTYTGTLCVATNDPDEPIVPVPVTLEVINGIPPIYTTFMPLIRRD